VCEFRVPYIFADRTVQTSTVNTVKIDHKPTNAIDQRDLEFTIPADDEHYLDPIMQISQGAIAWRGRSELDDKDFTAGVNNMLHSLFDQCNKSKRYVDNPLVR
jgi:hypothetical protein